MNNFIFIRDVNVCLSTEKNDKINIEIRRFVQALKKKKQSISYYKKARNVSSVASTIDNYLGKKGEFIASHGLHQHFSFPLIEPDLNVYASNNKDWSSDLHYEGIGHFHVKTCNGWGVNFFNDYTWTFQIANNKAYPGGREDIFTNPKVDDYIVLVYVHSYLANKGIIKAVLPLNKVQTLFQDPLLKKYVGQKQCLYYEYLKDNIKI